MEEEPTDLNGLSRYGLVTEEEAQPGIKVRALADYCDTFGCPFGAIGTIVGRSDFSDEQHLTIRWELPAPSASGTDKRRGKRRARGSRGDSNR